MTKQTYAMRLDSLLNGIRLVGNNLDFLCSLIEDPIEEYKIPDAVEYSNTVVCLMDQLTYMTCEIEQCELTDDGDFVILTKKQVDTLSALSEKAEDAMEALRECGISLANN